MDLTFSQACENNKLPILTKLNTIFNQTKQVLEIGSGTGQHSVYFAEHLPHLSWQTSDLDVHHYSINARREDSALPNLFAPISLDLNNSWSQALSQSKINETVDGIFTANTLHIISWSLVESFFNGVKQHLAAGGLLCIYGPFNYHGKFTSESNANFELWLKSRNEQSGIRDFEKIESLANDAGLTLIDDYEMPANNRLLVFKKK